MADHKRHPNGTTLLAGERPHVRLPRDRPRVNLPTISPPAWTTGAAQPYYTASAEPSVVTLNDYLPYPGIQQPRVKIPLGTQWPVRNPSNLPQPSAVNDLDPQLQGMTLSSEVEQAHITRQSSRIPGHTSNQSLSRRPNQAQRRQHNLQSKGVSQPDSSHLQTFVQMPPYPHSADSRQSSVPSVNGRNQGLFATNELFSRPPVPQRQLYDPNSNSGQTRQNRQSQGYSRKAGLHAQAEYLDRLAFQIIPKVEISREEFANKEALRSSLEDICRKAVTVHEAQKDPSFVSDSVELKCFGSLSTTFATKSSDMDLILLSPQSIPALSSPESEIPRLIEHALLESGYGARLLTKTRVPIIRFCEKPTAELAGLLKEERLRLDKEMNATPLQPKAKKKSKRDTVDSNPSNPMQTECQSDIAGTEGAHFSGEVSASPTDIKDATTSSLGTTKGPNKMVSGHEHTLSEKLGKQGDDNVLMAKSDEELTGLYKLAVHEGWYEPAERKTIDLFIRISQNPQSTEQDILTARSQLRELPNVIGRYQAPPKPHRLEFPKDGVGIQCDINFSNQLALHNSRLLKCYSICDPRVRRMVLFVKAWSKNRKINSPYHGTLSSYGYVLMVLHYLVNVAQPPVTPNLQTMPQSFDDELSMNDVMLDGHDIRFFRNENAIEELRRRKCITNSEESLGSLLRGFFHYYAQQGYNAPAGGFQWTFDTLSLRTIGGILSKQVKGWTGAKTETMDISGPGPAQTKEIRQRYLFAIEDPFEIEHNIARTVVHNGIVAIRDEFRRAHRLIENLGLLSGKGEQDMFAEAEDKENLQYKAFGPRPRKDQGVAKGTEKRKHAVPMPQRTDSARAKNESQ